MEHLVDVSIKNCERAYYLMQKEILDFICSKNVQKDYRVSRIIKMLGDS